MSSKEERVGLEVLQRLLDQRAQGRRGDLELDARLRLELGQQVAERAMIVLVAGHQDAELGAGIFLRIVAGGPRGHRCRTCCPPAPSARPSAPAPWITLRRESPPLAHEAVCGLAGFSRPYRPRAWSLPFFSVAIDLRSTRFPVYLSCHHANWQSAARSGRLALGVMGHQGRIRLVAVAAGARPAIDAQGLAGDEGGFR